MINPKIFKAYDIRGIYPDEINENNVEIITKAIIKFFQEELNKKTLNFVLGYDMRISSPAIFQSVKNTLIKYGQKVINIGLSTTPTIYFYTYYHNYDVGIQISASHNPKDYNGIKLVFIKDKKLFKVSADLGMDKIKDYSIQNNFDLEKNPGEVNEDNTAIKQEVDFAFNLVKPNIKKFKIVVDPANAMGIPLIDEIFKRTQCQLIKLNYQLDGTFPSHEANPLKFETLKDLQKKVIEEKADFGIATDGDGDRVFFIDDLGQIVPSTITSSIIAREILSKNKNEIILVDVRYIKNTSNLVKKMGGKVDLNRVGHSLITKKLNEVGAAFSGESSGHYFFRETGGAESTARVILHLLDVLTKENKKLSTLVKELMTSYESGEYNFKLPKNLTKNDLFEKIKQIYSDGQLNLLDGISIDYPNWRFNIRGSNTEPLIRLNLESESRELTNEKLNELKNQLIKIGCQEE